MAAAVGVAGCPLCTGVRTACRDILRRSTVLNSGRGRVNDCRWPDGAARTLRPAELASIVEHPTCKPAAKSSTAGLNINEGNIALRGDAAGQRSRPETAERLQRSGLIGCQSSASMFSSKQGSPLQGRRRQQQQQQPCRRPAEQALDSHKRSSEQSRRRSCWRRRSRSSSS